MNELILKLNGITPNANDFTDLSLSIGSELTIITEADTKINDIIFTNDEKIILQLVQHFHQSLF